MAVASAPFRELAYSTSNEVHLKENLYIFQNIIEFIYTGKVSVERSKIIEYKGACSRWGIDLDTSVQTLETTECKNMLTKLIFRERYDGVHFLDSRPPGNSLGEQRIQ